MRMERILRLSRQGAARGPKNVLLAARDFHSGPRVECHGVLQRWGVSRRTTSGTPARLRRRFSEAF